MYHVPVLSKDNAKSPKYWQQYCTHHNHQNLSRAPRPAQWIAHANLLRELREQELAKSNDSRRTQEKQHARSLAHLKQELEEERERVYAAVSEERDASLAQLRAAQEV